MTEPSQVLVVDDDPGWRLTISVLIDPSSGLELLAARSLAAAFALDNGPVLHAVVIDPAGSAAKPTDDPAPGIAVLADLRATWPAAAIYAYTYRVDLTDAALAAGADAVISKETDPRTVLGLLAIAVRD